MQHFPVRVFLIILFVVIGCFGISYAAAGMLTALPTPAVGGTCGPSTASETAAEALAEPGSIGAGPVPPTSNVTGHHQWETFVEQCQTLADRRGLASLAIFVISIVVSGVGLVWVLRRPKTTDEDEAADGAAYWAGDPGTLVGAGAMATPGMPVMGWGMPPQYGYAPAYPYPGQPMHPGYPPPQPGGVYPPAMWPGGQPMPPPVPYGVVPPTTYLEPPPAAPPYAEAPSPVQPPPVYPPESTPSPSTYTDPANPTNPVDPSASVAEPAQSTDIPASTTGDGGAIELGADATSESVVEPDGGTVPVGEVDSPDD